MDSALEKTNIDINLMLINWGLMPGEYRNGVIKTTKFGLFNMWFAFLLFSYQIVKYIILMFHAEDSQVDFYFGKFAKYFGPKIVVDFIAEIQSLNSAILIGLFYFSCKNRKKMLFWLDFVEYDRLHQSFYKLNLSLSESEKFTNQFLLMWFFLKRINYFLSVISYFTMLFPLILFKQDNLIYYLISVSGFEIGVYYFAHHWFSLNLILYQVKFYIKIIILSIFALDLLLFSFEI